MKNRRDKALYIIITIMGIVTLTSLCFVGVLSMMYLDEKNQLEQAKKEEVSQVAVEAVALQNEPQDIESILAQKEIEVTLSMKEKMKELSSSKDGGPLTMLRYFFPENLIFYDEGAYTFEPIVDNVKKHNLKNDNFVINGDEMQYVQNGNVISHKGIDVSKYQGNIDWEKVKNDGVEFAIVRLGLRGYESGKIVIDDYFKRNMRGANDAGVKAGAYFFTQAITVEEAKEEAEFVIDNLSDCDVPYPVVFDVEMIVGKDGRANNLTKEERTDITIAFCEAVKEAGYIPMIYGNVKCFTKLLDMTRLEQYDKWYAFYDKYLYFPYELGMWQYSEKGTVDGIKGNVDINISFKEW